MTESSILSGEIDVPVEGTATIEYDPPFTSWCSHKFWTDAPNIVRTIKDSKSGCTIGVFFQPPPLVVGKDRNGNDILHPVPMKSVGGHVKWKVTGV